MSKDDVAPNVRSDLLSEILHNVTMFRMLHYVHDTEQHFYNRFQDSGSSRSLL